MKHTSKQVNPIPSKLLDVLVHLSPTCVVVVNKNHIITHANHTERLVGYKPDDVIGKNVRLLVPHSFHSLHKKHMMNYFKSPVQRQQMSNIAKHFKLLAVHKDGHEFPVDISLTPISVDGELLVACYMHDLTDYYNYTKELERANNAKKEFLSKMSHEIRTPLGGLIGLVQLLERTELSKQQREIVDDIKRCSRLVNTIIGDILDCSRIEAGKVTIEESVFNLVDTIKTISRIQENMITKKGLTWIFDIPNDLPQWVMGDSTRLQQILNNLLTNARKFTNTGTIKLSIKHRFEKDTSYVWVLFEVIDTGIGISEENMKKLFIPFQQVHSNRSLGGSGLGLVISKQLTELLGGKMWVKSKEGVGSTFSFEIPFKVENNAPKLTTQKKVIVDKSLLKDIKILVCEDNLINQKVLQRLLHIAGFSCDVACDGEKGLEMWEKAKSSGRPYNLIFMDCIMPKLDGFETTRIIRKREKELNNGKTVIVAVTANALKEDRDKCIECGMDDFLVKPLKLHKLLQILSDTFGINVKI